MAPSWSSRRAVSPVIGVVALVAVVVVLVAVVGIAVLELTAEREPRPEVILTADPVGDGPTKLLLHEEGPPLDGDAIRMQGTAAERPFAGETLSAGVRGEFVPVRSTVEVTYVGEHGTTYTLATFDAERTAPPPDEGCEWVESRTDGGSDSITIDGVVIHCEVETTEGVEIQDGGVVIGAVASEAKDLDADDATIYGDADVETVLNVQDGTVTGSATSRTADVKLQNTTVSGSAAAARVLELTDGSHLAGDAESTTKTVKILSSTVDGSIHGEGVKLQDATVEGQVFTDPAAFDCTNATIDGQNCSTYTPRDPDA
ncbi:MAG: type IV pilin [Halococcoides sp.]